MIKGKLGFGWMRLPQLSADPTDIDYDQVNQMVDEYLDAGFNYFDTSYVYHNGSSEPAIKRCLVDRYDRDAYFLASKLPIFSITEEHQVQEIFDEQLAKCGVEYFDNFLLHNMNLVHYSRQVKDCHMFEHMREWEDEGKIKHIGLSFHDSADVLDRILTEHPEVEFVQIALNYLDWESYFIQSHKCYEVIRAHGCDVVAMEPVKGGALANVADEAAALLHGADPDASTASWAVRFPASLDGVLVSLSGMSNLEQVRDNISYMKKFKPLSDEERAMLARAAQIIRTAGPAHIEDYRPLESVNPRGVTAAAIIEAYNDCLIQPNPGFAAENNYYTVEKAKHGLRTEDICLPAPVIAPDGSDITELAQTAEKFMAEHPFATYEPLS